MLTLHLTSSPWFLLLLPPGFFILWRQYLRRRGTGPAGPPAAGLILFGLQALALLLLVLSLTAPELRRHRVEFHNPAVLILRDQSGSFRNGAYLGLGDAYAKFGKALVETYRGRKFDVRVADFHERTSPVAGFPGARQGKSEDADDPSARLTSLVNAADFTDSAAIPNLQAVFLFSDGRANLDSGKAPRTWSAPLFPVLIEPDSIGEIQPRQVSVTVNPVADVNLGANVNSAPDRESAEVAVAYQNVGAKATEASLRLVQSGKTLLNRKFPAGAGAGTYRFAWTPDKSLSGEASPIKAILQPANSGANFDPYNDTVTVVFPSGRTRRNIYVLRPIRGLDEKGMLDILSASEAAKVSFFAADELGRLSLTAKDQIWIEAGALSRQGRLSETLSRAAAKVVIYVRPEGGGRDVAALAGPWHAFSPEADIKVSKTASDVFPDEVVRLKGLTQSAVDAPETVAGVTPLVEMGEGGKRGVLMGKVSLAEGKRALLFVLPRIWDELFDPQADFATRANITAYVRAVETMAEAEDGAIRVSRPGRAYHMIPFDMDFRLPETGGPVSPAAVNPGGYRLSVKGPGVTMELPSVPGGDPDELEWKRMAWPQGKYRLELRRGGESLWSDSLEVASKAALELARIGFDRAVLEEAALRSGGRILTPARLGASANPASRQDTSRVASMLPDLPTAQIRMEKTQAFRMYDTIPLFVATLLILSLSWLLRKKWDLD